MLTKEESDQWLEGQFEYEFCPECGGDACDHTVTYVLGNPFAMCKCKQTRTYRPGDDCEHCDYTKPTRRDHLRGVVCRDCDSALDEMLDA